ncbi:hypothetical protein Tco_1387524 [Tanacetum coccineum]
MSSSTVTYTSISSEYEEPSNASSPGVVVYGYDGLPMHPVDPNVEAALQAPEQEPPSPDYVPGLEHPPSPEYVPGPEEPEQAPLSPDYLLPDDALLAALSTGYIADSDSKEDPKEDPFDYPADGGDDADNESSDDDDDEDDDDEEQEAFEDVDGEEEEYPAPTDSFVVPAVDPVSLAEDIEAFETNESAPTPVPSPRRRTARMSI